MSGRRGGGEVEEGGGGGYAVGWLDRRFFWRGAGGAQVGTGSMSVGKQYVLYVENVLDRTGRHSRRSGYSRCFRIASTVAEPRRAQSEGRRQAGGRATGARALEGLHSGSRGEDFPAAERVDFVCGAAVSGERSWAGGRFSFRRQASHGLLGRWCVVFPFFFSRAGCRGESGLRCGE